MDVPEGWTEEGWGAVWKNIAGLRDSVARHKQRAALANRRADAAEARAGELKSKLARARVHVLNIEAQMNSLERSVKLLHNLIDHQEGQL